MSQKPFCLMPWIHLHSSDKGMVKACCVANIPLGNINEKSAQEIWNGPEIQKLRRHFLENRADNRCAQCLNLEASGGKSIRLETFDKFGAVSIKENEFVTSKSPFYFDIRFSNACNFKCRTCWHGASSAWFKDAKILGNTFGQKALIQNILDFDRFIEQWGFALSNAKEIYFAGGEPLFTEEHYLLLKHLIQQKSTDIILRYNTNFSILHYKHFDLFQLWKHFSKIEILASLDGFGSTGEYIRSGMDWEIFLKNRELLKNHKEIHIDFKVAPTVSVLNILHLPDLIIECVEKNVIQPRANNIYLNILERPDYYNIQILPSYLKKQVSTKFDEFFRWAKSVFVDDYEQLHSTMMECINYMNHRDQSHLWEAFHHKNNRLDEIRKEELNTILPELKNV